MKREPSGSINRIATVVNFLDTNWGVLNSKGLVDDTTPIAGNEELIHSNKELSESLCESTLDNWNEKGYVQWRRLFSSRNHSGGWFWYFTPERMWEIDQYVKAKDRRDYDLAKERMKLLTSIGKQKPQGVAVDVSVLEKFGKFLVPEMSPTEIMDIYNFVRDHSTPLNKPKHWIDQEKCVFNIDKIKKQWKEQQPVLMNLPPFFLNSLGERVYLPPFELMKEDDDKILRLEEEVSIYKGLFTKEQNKVHTLSKIISDMADEIWRLK